MRGGELRACVVRRKVPWQPTCPQNGNFILQWLAGAPGAAKTTRTNRTLESKGLACGVRPAPKLFDPSGWFSASEPGCARQRLFNEAFFLGSVLSTAARYTYQVLGAWPEKLWKQRKLTTATFRADLYLTRDGLPGRKRNLEEAEAEENRQELEAEIAENTKQVQSDPDLYKPFPVVPEAVAWLEVLQTKKLRYPILVVLGASLSGKTEFAKSLFRKPLELKVGPLGHFPDALRRFDRKVHDGIVLDDIRDLAFLTENQDKLQGKYDALLEFASTPGGQCKFDKYLYKTPVVVTANYSTANLGFLDTHDWLGKPGNRTVVHYTAFAQP